ncbi:MAG TPA: hypothetical protein VF042_04545 [Gemmatimonadaceae bacterium]
MRIRSLATAFLLVAAASACSSATTTSGGDRRNNISTDEIRQVSNPGWSAYDLISKVRPDWLRSRSAQTLREPDPIFAVIYVDDIYHGELESLKDITVSRVESVQFISAYDTTARFGQTYQGGAIMVRTHE